MEKTITVTIKNVYGTDRIYPACETSRLLVVLAKAKTFSAADIKTVKALGYSIEVQAKTL
ncbi:hypothetical protein LCGC14_1207870 [marine sediment metagenome]|uniref:Uncharacterized protein n=1 Tax=marine sediment metagenome TaxID=412755 RepID=A0A0F9LJD4_9ZZZZ|nr:hypothetical protein [Actinomycetota bacterium]